MNKALTLSIVIPVYNEENYLESCLDLIAAQTVSPDEVIIVDNGSTDNTVKIVKKYPFVTLIHEKKKSVLFARNRGFDAASSDLIGRIDADTLISKDWSKNAKKIFTNSEITSLTGPTGIYDMPFPNFTRRVHDILLKIAIKTDFHFLTGCNMVIRNSAWKSVRKELCTDTNIYEDIDLAAHLKKTSMIPSYSSALWSNVSSRRFRDKLPEFIKYIHRYSVTLKRHDARVLGSYFGEILYVIVYIISKPLFWFFDPVKRRLSLSYFFKPKIRRVDPMDGRLT